MWPFKSRKIPCFSGSKYPTSAEANQWMTDRIEYYKKYYPKELPTLFSPACGDYLPIFVHVGSSWKPEHQEYYRILKAQNWDAVMKAREFTFGLPGRISLSRVGDPADFYE